MLVDEIRSLAKENLPERLAKELKEELQERETILNLIKESAKKGLNSLVVNNNYLPDTYVFKYMDKHLKYFQSEGLKVERGGSNDGPLYATTSLFHNTFTISWE